jgi:hypothetical protein
MAAMVLNSPRAVEMSVYVVRAFVKLREVLSANHVLSRKLDELEQRLTKRLDEHDEAIQAILSAIRELMSHEWTEGASLAAWHTSTDVRNRSSGTRGFPMMAK